MNYEKDLRIDADALDLEWIGQATLSMKYVKHFAQCRKRLTNAEENIKVIRAELIQKANSDPVRFCKKEKPNAADIEAYYRNHPRHKEAKDEWVEAQYEFTMAEGAKNEFSFTRKAALENMVTLHGQNYFAGPSMPLNLNREWEKKQAKEDANERAGKGADKMMRRIRG
jgi:hypothetical protein